MARTPAELIDLMQRQRGGRNEPAFAWLAKMDPEYMEALNRLAVQALSLHGDGSPDNSVLTSKVKGFVQLGILAAQRDFATMPKALGRLMDDGATDREILEVFQLAGTISGMVALRVSTETFLEAKKKRGQPV